MGTSFYHTREIAYSSLMKFDIQHYVQIAIAAALLLRNHVHVSGTLVSIDFTVSSTVSSALVTLLAIIGIFARSALTPKRG
jgi:hypothetical protein